MQIEDFMAKLEGMEGVELADNQAVRNDMADGMEVHAMCGPPPGAESLIAGAFSDAMPVAAAPTLDVQEPQNNTSFEIPTMGGQPS